MIYRLAPTVRPEPFMMPARFPHPAIPGRSFSTSLMNRPNAPMTSSELEALATRFEFEMKPDGRPVDFVQFGNGHLIISERVRNAIDVLEPRTHQMMRYELVAPKAWRRLVPAQDFFLLNCCVRINFIDVERSELTRIMHQA